MPLKPQHRASRGQADALDQIDIVAVVHGEAANGALNPLTDIASLNWEPCGQERNFNINTELRVAAGTSNPKTTTSFLSMDSTDGSITTTYHFAWKTCP